MVKYFAEFDDIDNNRIKVDIDIQGAAGDAIELTIADPAITIDYISDNIFTPLKKSGASINLLVPNVIESLFTGELLNPTVSIYKNNELFWFGYITPNIYSQPYKDTLDLLTIECVDTLSNLGNIDFKKSTDINSFLGIITTLLNSVDSSKLINNIYIPTSVKLNNDSDILSTLYIAERNFYDEKEEPQKSDEVLSDLLQYLGFTIVQYKDSYYILSHDSISTGDYSFLHYNRTSGSKTQTTLSLSPRNIMDIGIGIGNGTVSLGGVYNKLTLIANNNPLGTILPSFDDENDIVNQNSDPNKRYEESYSFDDKNYILLSGYFKSKGNWGYTVPTANGTVINEVTASNRDSITNGIFWQNVDSYLNDDGEPSTVNWRLNLTMCGGGLFGFSPTLILNNTKKMIVDGGYLIANIKYKFSTDKRAHSVVKSMYDHASTFGTCTNLKWTSNSDYIGYNNWPDNTMFPCKITIGGYYYSGDDWISYTEFNAKTSRGYYSLGSDNIHGYPLHGGDGSVNKNGDWEHWYRIKNSYGDWLYVTKEVYQSNTGLKESGNTKTNHHFWYVNGDNVTVHMNIEYYHEIILKDWFYLVHVNKTSENIYDTEYSLTNTVSYKMNIVDSSDGVAIRCRDDLSLYGNLTFELRAPTKLGSNPQHRSDIGTTTLRAIHITDLTLKYSKSNSYNSIYSTSTTDPDVIYTNVINSGFCQEMDDITLKVNTENEIATSYSYVMGKNGSNYYYIDGLTFKTGNSLAENKIVERYINYYSTPKYKYSNTLKNDDVTPFSLITETNLNKTMIVNRASYDLSNNRVEIELNQI